MRHWRSGWIAAVIASCTFATVHAKITTNVPLQAVLVENPYIFSATVATIDPDRPAMVLTVKEQLKGKAPFVRMAVHLKGDGEALEEKQTPRLLKRLALDLPLIIFVSQRQKEYVAFAYTNGTWFQMIGTEADGKTVWSFTHFEPYLRKTFKGTTAELTKTLMDGLAGKKMPDVNLKERPGLGPEIESLKRGRRNGGGGTTGPVLGVIPSVLVGGPLALLAMLFPALFGGLLLFFRRWMVALSVLSFNSTLYVLQDWFSARLIESWWGRPLALWLSMSVVTLVGTLWAWRRHAHRLADGDNAFLPPGKWEVATLTVFSVIALGGAVYGGRATIERLNLLDKTMLMICAGLWLATLHALVLRFVIARRQNPRPGLPGEGVMLWGMLCACTGLAATFSSPLTRGGGQDAIEQTQMGTAARFERVAWKHSFTEPCWIASSPTVAGTDVFIGVVHGALNRSGAVYCLNRDDGKVRWTFNDGGKMKDVFSSPTASDGRLYIGEGFHQNQNCKLYCLDCENGEKLWDFQTSSHTESTPCIANGLIYFGAGDDGLFCLDAASGKEVWHQSGLHVDANPLVVDGKLYCGSGSGDVYKDTVVFCREAATGKELWRMPVDLPMWGGAALLDGKLYVGIGNGNYLESDENEAGAVLCLNAANGQRLWRADARDGVHGRVTAAKNGIFFASRDHFCYCVDPATGREIWKKDLGSPVVASPFLTAGDADLIVVASEGKVACLDAKTGAGAWTFDVEKDSGQPAMLFSSPVVVNNRDGTSVSRQIYFGSGLNSFSRGILYCLEDTVAARISK